MSLFFLRCFKYVLYHRGTRKNPEELGPSTLGLSAPHNQLPRCSSACSGMLLAPSVLSWRFSMRFSLRSVVTCASWRSRAGRRRITRRSPRASPCQPESPSPEAGASRSPRELALCQARGRRPGASRNLGTQKKFRFRARPGPKISGLVRRLPFQSSTKPCHSRMLATAFSRIVQNSRLKSAPAQVQAAHMAANDSGPEDGAL